MIGKKVTQRRARAALGALLAAALVTVVMVVPLTASGATNSPILVGNLTTEGTAIINEVGPAASLAAGILYINKAGGINGHPLKLVVCNDQGDPNQAAACAREMVSDHVVATFGDLGTGNADEQATILNAAHIPQIEIQAASNTQYSCGTCFPIGTGSLGYVGGMMSAWKKQGLSKVYVVGVNLTGLTQITQPYATTAAQSVGLTVAGTSLEPPGVADWTPVAAQIAASGAQAVWTFLIGADGVNLVKALQEVGYKGKIAVIYAYTPAELSELGTASNGQVVSFSPNPPLTASIQLPGVAKYLKQIQTEYSAGNGNAAASNLDLSSGTTWAALYAFAGLAKGLKKVTAGALLKVLKAQKTPVSMQGFVDGGWTPGKTSGAPSPLQKAGPLTGYPLVLKNNVWYLNGKPENIGSVLKVMLKS